MPQAQRESARPLSRVERKKLETRDRITREAELLMRSRPVGDITIQDITEAADVGHGSFYLHFGSKYEVLIPIIDRLARQWDQAIQAAMRDQDDPAQVVAFSSRQMGRMIVGDPLWCWLLQNSAVAVDDMRGAIGRFAARDLGKGLVSGRFQVPELALASSFMIGALVNGLVASLSAADQEVAIDQVTELMLRTLGIEPEEARLIAHQPLEPLVMG